MDKSRHTMTVAVWQVQREQEVVDSGKTVPLVSEQKLKKEALSKCRSDKISRRYKEPESQEKCGSCGGSFSPSQSAEAHFTEARSFSRC